MGSRDRWKLAERLNVYQIALLMCGFDPKDFLGLSCHDWDDEVKKDTAAALNALMNVVITKGIDCYYVYYENAYDGGINWGETLVSIDALRDWLHRRNYADGFFIAREDETLRLADPKGEHYAPKLAAAVRAWNEVTSDPQLLNGKSPKKALEIWLRKHANEYHLTNKDGNPNETGIEEICKVANWRPAGGASPTPTRSSPTSAVSRQGGGRHPSNPPTPSAEPSLEDDLPF